MKTAAKTLREFKLPVVAEVLQTDNGLEFQEDFQATAKELGYQTRFNHVASPEENGEAIQDSLELLLRALKQTMTFDNGSENNVSFTRQLS